MAETNPHDDGDGDGDGDDKALIPPSLRDAAYTSIGLAVLGFQRLQVCRRDVERLVGKAKEHLESYEGPAASR